MVQLILQVLIVGLIAGLVGIIWMVVRHSFDDDYFFDDNRQGRHPSLTPGNGNDPHEPSPRPSKIAA